MADQNLQNSLLGKIAAYTEILAKDPRSTIFVSLSEAYRKMGMLDDAYQVISKGLDSNVDFGPAHIVLACIQCQQGEYSASETSFQKALECDAESLAALVGYARLKILLGEETGARQLLLQARQLSPADPVINKLLLSLPEESPVVDPVEEEVAPVVETEEPVEDKETEGEQDPEEGEESSTPPLASATLADLYLKQGLTEQALEVYRRLSAEDPDNLEFRRRIRDLEEGQFAPEIEPEPEQVEAEPAEIDRSAETIPDVAEDEPIPVVESFASDEIESQAANGLSLQDEKALATLNRWLDSIQQRRENV